jgi:hypothetical protein
MDFLKKYKKIFITIGFIIIIIGIGYLLYAVFFKPVITPTETQTPTATSTTAGGLPTSPLGQGQIVSTGGPSQLPGQAAGQATASEKATGGVTKTANLTDNPSLGVVLDANGENLKYYNKSDGKFYSITPDGQASLLTDKVFYSAEKVTWSSDRNRAIIEYPDGSNITYDFTTNTQITLPKHWEGFAYSPSGNQIVAKSLAIDEANRWLIISNDDGSKATPVEHIGNNDNIVYPSWSPNNQIIALYTKGSDFDRQEVYFLGQNSENFKSTTVEGRGFEFQWDASGSQLLYSVYSDASDLKPILWMVNSQGDSIGTNRRSLNVETWASKCAFSSDTILYCAVPTSLETGSGLFKQMADNTTDQLYQIDTQTGLKKLIATPDTNYTIDSLTVTRDGKYLYFTDKSTEKIHKINL